MQHRNMIMDHTLYNLHVASHSDFDRVPQVLPFDRFLTCEYSTASCSLSEDLRNDCGYVSKAFIRSNKILPVTTTTKIRY